MDAKSFDNSCHSITEPWLCAGAHCQLMISWSYFMHPWPKNVYL